jgi:acetyl-CoA carboxylase biotin carboxylase subunit
MFRKILVANRGEIAVRIIRACRELGIPTVAVFSEADRDALHVRLADESVCIGPAGNGESYLNAPHIATAAVIHGCDAIHPGYGYLSEDASFAEICQALEITFIGPPPEAIRQMGDKALARRLAEKARVPVVPGVSEVLSNGQGVGKIADRLGFPLMVKAAGGGGGRGIRIVNNEQELPDALQQAQAEAKAAFGNGAVYIEKFLREPRHVEVQILADQEGHVIHLGERDCSVQTPRHQKLLEEAPCASLKPHVRRGLCEAAVKLAKAVGYTNAGTVEFLLNGDGSFYFIEMNTRIQVEHPVTEMVTGVDIVREQIRIAAGEPLSITQRQVRTRGHAIECRICAQDPDRDFAPCCGMIERYVAPGGPGIRVDSGVSAGTVVSPHYDPMQLKIIAWGADRPQAIRRMRGALRELEIEGIATTRDYHLRILDDEVFLNGQATTNFVRDRLMQGASEPALPREPELPAAMAS